MDNWIAHGQTALTMVILSFVGVFVYMYPLIFGQIIGVVAIIALLAIIYGAIYSIFDH